MAIPHSKEVEEAFLGAVLLEKDSLDIVIESVHENLLYATKNALILKSILCLHNSDRDIDVLTVIEELRSSDKLDKVGGSYEVARLTGLVSSSSHIETHIKILQELYLKRELIKLSSKVHTDCMSGGDVFDSFAEVETRLSQLENQLIVNKPVTIRHIHDEVSNHVKELVGNLNQITGIESGFIELDRNTGGWQKGNLIILAARPGMGKTSLALSYLKNPALRGVPTAFFSLEMSNRELFGRMLSIQHNIEGYKFKRGGFSQEEYNIVKSSVLKALPIYFDDKDNDIYNLKIKARKLKRDHDIQLLIVDYLQLISSNKKHSNREGEITFISRSLKQLAKELDIPVIALSQLSREVEKRGDKIPQLSDLRESGAIEQDADVVQFIYRPEYYGIEFDSEGGSVKNKAIGIIAKNRNGVCEDIAMSFEGKFTKFDNYNYEH